MKEPQSSPLTSSSTSSSGSSSSSPSASSASLLFLVVSFLTRSHCSLRNTRPVSGCCRWPVCRRIKSLSGHWGADAQQTSKLYLTATYSKHEYMLNTVV